jgi:hypothetical protein
MERCFISLLGRLFKILFLKFLGHYALRRGDPDEVHALRVTTYVDVFPGRGQHDGLLQ